MFRRAPGLVGCLLVVFLSCFAAFSQPQLASAAKPAETLPLFKFHIRDFGLRQVEQRECCFCGKNEIPENNIGQHLNRDNGRGFEVVNDGGKLILITGPRFRFASPTSEIHEIDFEGLKKILQRDPKDTRPLLINFWATWCDGCREEFPDLVKIDNDYNGRLNFISVSLDDVTDIKTTVPEFLKSMNARMPVVLLNVKDPEPSIHAVDATWDGALPATYLYDKDGKVVFKYFGAIKPAELRAAIDKAVGSKH